MAAESTEPLLARCVASWCADATGVSAVTRLSGGASQETWSFDIEHPDGNLGAILRRAPAGYGAASGRACGLDTEAALIDMANEMYDRDFAPKLWPETVALTQAHLEKGHEVWLVTATPQLVAQVIAERLGLTGAIGTRVEALDGVFTGALDGHVIHGDEKAAVARSYARDLGADLADCWAYSDSSNDIPLLTLVGNRMVINPDAKLQAHAQHLGWTVLPLKRSSIRDAQKKVRREARAVKRRK